MNYLRNSIYIESEFSLYDIFLI